MKIRATIMTGMGEGHVFLSLPAYQEGFLRALGFSPFAGTLNLRIRPEEVAKIDKHRQAPDASVPGFTLDGREYFQIKLARARVLGETGALVFPYFQHHPPEVLEFVADGSLREKYGLQDGDEVEIEIDA